MSTFVLVHGAWHGGWCWDRVARPLREAGHDVHAPTLTGLSERAHLLSPLVGLETHVEDVVRVIDVLGLTVDVYGAQWGYAFGKCGGVSYAVRFRGARRVAALFRERAAEAVGSDVVGCVEVYVA